jgi:hypothetical protein
MRRRLLRKALFVLVKPPVSARIHSIFILAAATTFFQSFT